MLTAAFLLASLLPGAPERGDYPAVSHAISALRQDAQEEAARLALLDRWKQNHRSEHKVAYDAAREYLRRFPYDASDDAQMMRKWAAAYERVIMNNTAGTSAPKREAAVPTVSASERSARGAAHAKVHEWREAEDEFKAALVMEPTNAAYRAALADALRQQGKWADAEAQYRQLVSTTLDSYEFRRGLADSLYHLGRWAEAEAEYRKVLLLRPGVREEISHELAESLYRQQKFSEAGVFVGELLLKAYNDKKPDPEALALNWAILEAQGKTDDARRAFVTAVASVYENPKYRKLLEAFAARSGGPAVNLADSYWISSERFVHFLPGGKITEAEKSSNSDDYGRVRLDKDGTWRQVGNAVYVEKTNFCYRCVGVVAQNQLSLLGEWSPPPYGSSYSGGADLNKFDPDTNQKYDLIFPAKAMLSMGMPERAELLYRAAIRAMGADSDSNWIARAYAGLAVALVAQSKWPEAERAMGAAAKQDSYWRYKEMYKDTLKNIKARRRSVLDEGYY